MKAVFTYNLSDIIGISLGVFCLLGILITVAYVEVKKLIKKVRKVFRKNAK